MANYPFVGPADESSQYLASILQQYKPGTLGNTATIGNPQGQQDYAAQLAQALAEMETSTKQQERASTLQNPEFIQNSGGLGVLAMLAQAYAGKKMDEKAGKKYEEASMRAMSARSVLDEAKEEREAARKLKASQDEKAQRKEEGKAMGLSGRDLTRYALEGKMGEGVRGVPMMTDQGLVTIDPYTGQRIEQQREPVRTEFDGPDDERAAFDAMVAEDQRRGAPDGDQRYDNLTNQRPLMPYKDPAIAQRQAMADSRADESLGFARRAADRADRNESRAVEAERAKALQGPPKKAMGADAANKVGLYDNAIRAAKQWHEIVAEKDASGNYTGGYNNIAAMTPNAKSLYEQALRAKLRAESGAAISEPEIKGEMGRYGPKALGGDATDLRNASTLLRDLVQQRKLLVGSEAAPSLSVGQVIEKGGKKYRVVGGDPADPDVEEVR